MTPGWFAASLAEVEPFLEEVQLLERRNRFPRYDALSPSFIRSVPYAQSWQHCYDNQLFDFVLKDSSLIQFRAWRIDAQNIWNHSYSYLECPQSLLTYEEFCFSILKSSVSEIGDEFRDLYEEYALQASLKETVTPARYDYSPQDYREGVHPASLLHLGH